MYHQVNAGMNEIKVSFGCATVTVSRIGGGIDVSLEKKGGMKVTAALVCATGQGTRYLRVTPENPQTFHWISYTNEIVYDVQSNVNWDIS